MIKKKMIVTKKYTTQRSNLCIKEFPGTRKHIILKGTEVHKTIKEVHVYK
jgi:hypothetical protein